MFAAMDDAILAAFAEPFTYKGAVGDVVLQGVFDETIDPAKIGGIGVQDREFTLSLPQAIVTANAIALRNKVQIRGIDYQIVDIQVDVAGMATLFLRAY